MSNIIPKKTENIIIGTFILFSFISIFFLGIKEKVDRQKALQLSGWIAYFQEPQGNEIDFGIENYAGAKEYVWEIFLDDVKIAEGKSSVKNQEKKIVDISGIDDDISSGKYQGKKILIRIRTGSEKKEIYKVL